MTMRFELPTAPAEIADEVELWARESGRHATLRFVPILFFNGRIIAGTWKVCISLRPDDPALQMYQQGRVSEPPTEDVWLHEPNPKAGQPLAGFHGLREPPYIGYNLTDLGASGVRQFLEKGNTWSGRGIFRSLMDQLRQVREKNATARAKFRQDQKEANRDELMARRRQVHRIPFLRVGVDLSSQAEDADPGLPQAATTEET